MKLARSLALLGLSTALAGSQALAADYFVQAITPGAVSGTPLAVITLQSGGESAPSTGVPPVRVVAKQSERIGKWVKVRKEKGSEETSPEIVTTDETAAPEASDMSGSDGNAEVASSGDAGLSEGGALIDSEGTTEGSTALGESATAAADTTADTPAPTPTTTTTAPVTTAPATTPTITTTAPVPTAPTTNLVAPASTSGVAGPPGAQIWKNFDSLMTSGKVTGGDRIFLLDGYHGQILVRDKKFTSTVTIAPAAGAVAHADSVLVMNSSNVHIQGLKVWPRSSNAGNGALVRTYSSASNIAFTGLDVRGIATAGNYSSWTATDWNNYQRTGFQVDGPNITVARNRVTGIFNGIIMLGKNALLQANIVDGFSGDGMRALGDNSVVRGNKVQNCHQVNGSHTDAFQAWTNGPTGKVGTGTLRNVTIEDNKIFEFVGTRSPIACKLQGISLFAGVYDNFVIRNNVISTTAYHGITIAGGQNSQIVNNTVVHAFGTAGVYPWIRVSANRDGRPSLNVTVANNMTTSLKVNQDATKAIVATNNVVVTNASNEFAGVSKQDFNLRSGSKGVDAGIPALAPKDDIVGAARPKGKAPDAGAYENF